MRTTLSVSASLSRSLSVLLLASVAVGTAACSSGETTTTTTASGSSSTEIAGASSFCETYCGRVTECDSAQDAQTCATECDDATMRELRRFRTDFVESARACFAASDCRQVLSRDRLADCLSEALVSIAPAEAAKSFCDALGGAFRRCDAALDRAACLQATKHFNDATLARAERCTEKSCAAIADCVDAELGTD